MRRAAYYSRANSFSRSYNAEVAECGCGLVAGGDWLPLKLNVWRTPPMSEQDLRSIMHY
jgi:hypothetical protein